MNAPTRPQQDLDPILRYAPRRVREQAHADESFALPRADWPGEPHAENNPEFSGDQAFMEMQRRLAIEPEWVPQPPPTLDGRGLWRATLRAGGLLGVAALVAWLLVSTPLVKVLLDSQFLGARIPSDPVASNHASPQPLPTQDRLAAIDRVALTQYRTVSADPFLNPSAPVQNASAETVQPAMAFVDPSRNAGASPPALSTLPDIPGQPPKREAPAAAPSAPDFVTRQLDRVDVASFLTRADGFIKSGDLSSARLLLERAAEAGDARAAFTLAGTFDPQVLKALGLGDGAPDVAKARLWYERAATLGSTDAPVRLQQLATVSAD
jgi:hypothetical protein